MVGTEGCGLRVPLPDWAQGRTPIHPLGDSTGVGGCRPLSWHPGPQDLLHDAGRGADVECKDKWGPEGSGVSGRILDLLNYYDLCDTEQHDGRSASETGSVPKRPPQSHRPSGVSSRFRVTRA